MTDAHNRLKAWCHWKRAHADGIGDTELIKQIEDLISEVETLKVRDCGHSVHGSDACLNCETGRITVYAKSRWCMECQQKEGR
jgi:hypothetical protein